MFELKGKVALITGGLGGIGLEIAKAFLRQNVTAVILLNLRSEKREQRLKEVTINYRERVLFVPTDVTNDEEIKKAFEKVMAAFGRIDVVVNTAGVVDNFLGWRKCIDINLKGTMDVTLTAIEKYMNTGIIVNVASVGGLSASASFPSYCASKFGVIGFTKSIALKLEMERKNIKIIVICPGATNTPLFANCKHLVDEETTEKYLQIIQEPSYLADSLVKLMPGANNGSVWVVEEMQTYEIEMPNYKTLKKLKRT